MNPTPCRPRVRTTLAATAVALAAVAAVAQPATGSASDWSAITSGTIVLFRHAQAPGGGDPPEFRLDDCRTQRNLDDAGRAQARRIGEQFRARGIGVTAVRSSQWCRARETADLAFPGLRRDEPAFNSFFGRREQADAQTAAARAVLADWKGPGVMVVTTHQVNISALTGRFTASGEGIVVRPGADGLQVLGSVMP